MRHAAYLYYPNDELVLYIAIISPDNKVRFFTEAGTEAVSTPIPLERALQHGRFVQLGVTNRQPQPHSKYLRPPRPSPPPWIGGRRTVQPYFDPNLGCWRSHDSRNDHKKITT